MNEKDLYNAIVEHWGEHEAHADIYRELCKRAGVSLDGAVTVEQIAREAHKRWSNRKLQAVKEFRDEYEKYFGIRLDLRAAVNAFDEVVK
jgi:hypothetical protein